MNRVDPLRIGVVGCGDVAHRRYLPALEAAGDRVELVALHDHLEPVAMAAAKAVHSWAPQAVAYPSLGEMLEAARLDAAFNLTPAADHAAVSQACLNSGVA